MTATTESSLERFIAAARAAYATEPDPETRWKSLAPALAELLADEAVVRSSRSWPECTIVNNQVDNLLFYEDPDYRFVINGLVIPASGFNVTSRVHDHGHIYTLYGLLDGRQTIQRYERLDDGSVPEFADVRKTSDSEAGPGEVDLVGPFEIHAEDTLGERQAAIIVRSEKTGSFPQGRYYPDAKRYESMVGPRQTPHPFYTEAASTVA
jgi:predicted metal-dependent enzyme (double-stranded beta helix superfamily)